MKILNINSKIFDKALEKLLQNRKKKLDQVQSQYLRLLMTLEKMVIKHF